MTGDPSMVNDSSEEVEGADVVRMYSDFITYQYRLNRKHNQLFISIILLI